MSQVIPPSELKFGDVLLYHKTGILADIIRYFDRGVYSHASIFDGERILEATFGGVIKRNVEASVAGVPFVDVFRFSGPGNQEIGSQELPIAPLSDRIEFYYHEADRYAYEELLLLALLCTTRQIPLPPLVAVILRNALDTAADLIVQLSAAGKQPMICSELVYRCFSEASPDDPSPYSIVIVGADKPSAAIFGPFVAGSQQALLLQSAQRFLSLYYLAKTKAATETRFSIHDLAEGFAVADFVSPQDLQRSPNLHLLGRLEV